MGQQIFKFHKDLRVTFGVNNRTTKVNLSKIIPKEELIEQLDYTRSLRFQPNELIWLQGNTFYGKRGIFTSEYIDFLRTFQLPEYELKTDDNGDWQIEFPGLWVETTMWEIYVLPIINTLRNRHAMRGMSRFELDVLYSGAKTKLWQKLQKLRKLENLNLTDFGTRRRHDFLFQEWAVNAAHDALGNAFTGTSNTLIAMRQGLEAKGTNAHEVPMVIAAMCDNDEEIKQSQYVACEEWQHTYDGALLVGLPDTFGSTQYFRDAPDWLLNWTGFRFDSKNPIAAGDEMHSWLLHRGIDPTTKLGIFSDGLDVNDIINIHEHFKHRIKLGFGWGTLLTNDFIDCHPYANQQLNPISITCKVKTVNGRPAVKLSDNYLKATGDKETIARYIRIFGTSGMSNVPIKV